MASNVDTRTLENRGTQIIPKMDKSTYAAAGIEYAHHEVHAGKHFFISEGYAIADTVVRTIWFKTGNDGSLCHMLFVVYSSGAGVFRLVEGATNVIAPNLTPYNNRRPSGNVSAARWSTSEVAATGGTLLSNLRLGSNSLRFAPIGGGSGSREELILKADTLYAVELTAGVADIDANFNLEWYEHTDRE
jgi:hypothetical protein